MINIFLKYKIQNIKYNIYKASVSPDPVQQIMPYFQ
jgi:hypothetical protein